MNIGKCTKEVVVGMEKLPSILSTVNKCMKTILLMSAVVQISTDELYTF